MADGPHEKGQREILSKEKNQRKCLFPLKNCAANGEQAPQFFPNIQNSLPSPIIFTEDIAPASVPPC